MYRGGIETAIEEAVGFELLSRGIEVVLRLLLRGIETAIKVHAENVLKMHFSWANLICIFNLVFNYNFKTHQNLIKDK